MVPCIPDMAIVPYASNLPQTDVDNYFGPVHCSRSVDTLRYLCFAGFSFSNLANPCRPVARSAEQTTAALNDCGRQCAAKPVSGATVFVMALECTHIFSGEGYEWIYHGCQCTCSTPCQGIQCGHRSSREQVSTRILQTMVSGITLVSRFGTRM